MRWEKVELIPVSRSSNTKKVGATMEVEKVELIPVSNSSNMKKVGASMEVEKVELIPVSSSSNTKTVRATIKVEKVDLIPVSSSSNTKTVSATMKVEKGELIPESSSRTTTKVGASATPRKKRSPMTLATLKAVKDRGRKRGNRKTPGVVVKHFDNTDLGYDWLLPGWIAEERFVPTGRQGSGRNYKYYYDPSGHMYYTRDEVLFAWEKANIICLDV